MAGSTLGGLNKAYLSWPNTETVTVISQDASFPDTICDTCQRLWARPREPAYETGFETTGKEVIFLVSTDAGQFDGLNDQNDPYEIVTGDRIRDANEKQYHVTKAELKGLGNYWKLTTVPDRNNRL